MAQNPPKMLRAQKAKVKVKQLPRLRERTPNPRCSRRPKTTRRPKAPKRPRRKFRKPRLIRTRKRMPLRRRTKMRPRSKRSLPRSLANQMLRAKSKKRIENRRLVARSQR